MIGSMKKAGPTEAATGNLKYRCKNDNLLLYNQVVEVMERFVGTEKLRECHHAYSSQKKSMNKLISICPEKTGHIVSRCRCRLGSA
jgi:hypothetical protein